MGCFAQYAINLYSWMEVFSPPRRVLTKWISKNGSILCRNQSPFSPLIPLKAFLEIDYTESFPPLWITVALFQSHFFTVQRYGHLFYYTARCKAWDLNIRDHPFLRKILCTDSRTSVWVLGIALFSQISVITLVIPFQDPFSPIKIKMCVSWNLNTTLKWNDSTIFQLPVALFCASTDDNAHHYFSAVDDVHCFMVKLSLSAICNGSEV